MYDDDSDKPGSHVADEEDEDDAADANGVRGAPWRPPADCAAMRPANTRPLTIVATAASLRAAAAAAEALGVVGACDDAASGGAVDMRTASEGLRKPSF